MVSGAYLDKEMAVVLFVPTVSSRAAHLERKTVGAEEQLLASCQLVVLGDGPAVEPPQGQSDGVKSSVLRACRRDVQGVPADADLQKNPTWGRVLLS